MCENAQATLEDMAADKLEVDMSEEVKRVSVPCHHKCNWIRWLGQLEALILSNMSVILQVWGGCFCLIFDFIILKFIFNLIAVTG